MTLTARAGAGRVGDPPERDGMSAIDGMLGPWRKPARSGTRFW